MTFAQRLNRLTTRFSERIPVVKRGISVRTSCMRDRYSYTISTITQSMVVVGPADPTTTNSTATNTLQR